jgi:hypothetical protein
MGRVRGLVATVVAIAAMGVGVSPLAPAAPVGAVVDPNPTIDPFDRASVWSAYQESLVEPQAVPVGWTGSTASCTEGTESAASIQATQAAVNFYRGLVGLPGLANEPSGNADAMRAALIQSANADRGLSHFPPSDWRCWTQARATASENHNLASIPGAQGVQLFMVDPADSNDFAGHRNWVLHPRGTAFSTGSTSSHLALDVHTGGSVPAGVDWIAWPNEGFVPKTLIRPYVWWGKALFSLRNAAASYDYSGASVTVKVGSTTLPVEIRDRIGQVTWYTTLPSSWDSSGEVKLDVTVTGLKTSAGAAVPAHSYSTTAILGPTTGPTVPGAPTGVGAAAGNARATVSWTAPAATGGSPITGYKVTPYAGTTPMATRTFTTTATTQAITGLTNGTAYTFRVQAVNAVGTGPESAPSAAVTPSAPATTVPGAPTGVTATAGNGQASVTWTAPTATGGSPITGYKVTPYVGGTAQPVRTFTGTGTSRVVTGLTNGVGHTFRVQAVNAVGDSALSAPSGVVTPAGPPYAPYTSWDHLIDQVHRQLVGRAASPSELQRWRGPLQLGTASPGDVVAALRTSSHHTSFVDPVTRLYRAYFLRIPDRAGLEYWIERRRTGTSLATISTGFARSPEFRALYPNLTDRAFVQRVYQNVLGRAGAANEVDYWTREITSGRRNRGLVMIGFSEAPEYRTAQAAEVTVSVLHILWLDRAPTAQEHTTGVAALEGGQTVAAYAQGLLPRAVVLP